MFVINAMLVVVCLVFIILFLLYYILTIVYFVKLRKAIVALRFYRPRLYSVLKDVNGLWHRNNRVALLLFLLRSCHYGIEDVSKLGNFIRQHAKKYAYSFVGVIAGAFLLYCIGFIMGLHCIIAESCLECRYIVSFTATAAILALFFLLKTALASVRRILLIVEMKMSPHHTKP